MYKIFKKIPSGVFSVIATVIVAYVLLSPRSQFSSGWLSWLHFENSDKVVHFFMFLGLCFAYLFDYTKLKNPHHTKVNKELAIPAVASLVSLLTETAQLVMGLGRSFDVNYIYADVLGALVAFGLMRWKGAHLLRKYLFNKRRRHRHHHHDHGHHHHHHHQSGSNDSGSTNA